MTVRESQIYEKNYRIIGKNNQVKVYNEATDLEVRESIIFDSEKKDFSSLDYFISALVSDILLTIDQETKKDDEIIMDLESKTSLIVKNPLFLLGVKGYQDPAYIESIDIKIYLYTFMEEEKAEIYFTNILNKSLLYNTLKDKIQIEVNFEFII